MVLSIKTSKSPEEKTRRVMRGSNWKAAEPLLSELAKANEQDIAKWNLLGDVQFRAGDRDAAVGSWKRALDSYMRETLYENALGVARKIIRLVPEEGALYLAVSEAYLGLDYHADSISAYRAFVKLCKSSSSSDKKAWFRKIMAGEIRQPHLLEEIQQIFVESELGDIELERDLQAWCERMSESGESLEQAPTESFEPEAWTAPASVSDPEPLGLSTLEPSHFAIEPTYALRTPPARREPVEAEYGTDRDNYEFVEAAAESALPEGQGKDHYDLGVVYAEMKLWDAAITEFMTARRDQSLRPKATIELAECYKNANDPHRALKLLEEEVALGSYEADIQDALNYHMGVLHRMVGNGAEALACFVKVSAESDHYADAVSKAEELRD